MNESAFDSSLKAMYRLIVEIEDCLMIDLLPLEREDFTAKTLQSAFQRLTRT